MFYCTIKNGQQGIALLGAMIIALMLSLLGATLLNLAGQEVVNAGLANQASVGFTVHRQLRTYRSCRLFVKRDFATGKEPHPSLMRLADHNSWARWISRMYGYRRAIPQITDY
jgi:hypothetical protein